MIKTNNFNETQIKLINKINQEEFYISIFNYNKWSKTNKIKINKDHNNNNNNSHFFYSETDNEFANNLNDLLIAFNSRIREQKLKKYPILVMSRFFKLFVNF